MGSDILEDVGSSATNGGNSAKNKWQRFFGTVKNVLLGDFMQNYSQVDFGDSDAYNDGTDSRDAGRVVNGSEIRKRFHMGNEFGTASSNDVFFDGYEDPAFLTFKIEFGEWGASISQDSEIAEGQRLSLYSGVHQSDYDVMPMGLLDLNFDETREGDIASYESYNAVNFLTNRNQDRRAQYLAQFVKGLYTVQRDFPYMFQKINGIDKLSAFESTQGQRLKDCVLKLSCLNDGLDLKMRTLMELYRKAAWNDIYQRWELPDIHRYFKMIIYIFDHRQIAMGNGMFSPDNEYLPIIAYECSPCEFVIESQDAAEFSVNYQDLRPTEPAISIRVHNVRTFYANKMFQQVKYINDIYTKSMHDNFNDEDPTNQQKGSNIAWQYIWLQRMFMTPDEWGQFDGPSSWRNTNFYHAGPNDYDMSNVWENPDNIIDQEMDSTWHFATVSDEGYIIRNFSDLANAVKDIVMSRTQLVRDSRTSNRYYFVNDLTHVGWLNGSGHFRQPMFRIDTEGARADVIRTIKHMVRRLRGYKIDGPLNLLGDKIHDNKIKGPKYEHDLNEYPLTGAPGSYNPPRDSEVKEPSAYEHTMTEHEMETS